MFASPAILPLTQQENVNTISMKKVGSGLLSRKPFADRPVNTKTPEFKKPFKKSPLLPQVPNPETVPEKKQDLSFYHDFCSYRDFEDDFEDIWPKKDRLNRARINDFINGYCYGGKPQTPEPCDLDVIEPMFLELPSKDDFFQFPNVDFMDSLDKFHIDEVSFPELETDL